MNIPVDALHATRALHSAFAVPISHSLPAPSTPSSRLPLSSPKLHYHLSKMKFIPSPIPIPISISQSNLADNPSPTNHLLNPANPLLPRDMPAMTCYHPDGTPAAPTDQPCPSIPGTEFIACCPATDTCSDNGLCFSSTGQASRHSCTDPIWRAEACPRFCLGSTTAGTGDDDDDDDDNDAKPIAASGSVAMRLCTLSDDSAVYCCGRGSGVVEAEARQGDDDGQCNCTDDDEESKLVTVTGGPASPGPRGVAASSLSTGLTLIPTITSIATTTTASSAATEAAPLPLTDNSIPTSSSSGRSSSTSTHSTGPSASQSRTIIFAPSLPKSLEHLYSALIVMGWIWLASLLSLAVYFVIVRVWRVCFARNRRRRGSWVSSWSSSVGSDRRSGDGSLWGASESGSGSGLGSGDAGTGTRTSSRISGSRGSGSGSGRLSVAEMGGGVTGPWGGDGGMRALSAVALHAGTGNGGVIEGSIDVAVGSGKGGAGGLRKSSSSMKRYSAATSVVLVDVEKDGVEGMEEAAENEEDGGVKEGLGKPIMEEHKDGVSVAVTVIGEENKWPKDSQAGSIAKQ